MQRRRMIFLLLAVLSAATLLAGCGGSAKETQLPATGEMLTAGTPTTGMATCATCHTRVIADWMKTKHANAENGLNSAGSPNIGAMVDVTCVPCHDRNGDSASLTDGYTGNVDRPVTGCESCHGPGSLHANAGGVGPISLLSNTLPGTWGSSSIPVSGQFLMCTTCHELPATAGLAGNLLTTNQAGVETDTSGFTPIGGAVLIQSTTTFTTGAAALQIDAAAPGDGFYTNDTAVSSGYTYTASVWLRGDVGGETVVLTIEARTAASALVASYSTTTITLTTTFTKYSVLGLLEGTAVNARLSVVSDAAPETFYADELQITQSTPPSTHIATAPIGNQYIIADTHLARTGTWTAVTATYLSNDVLTNNTAAINGYAMDYNSPKVCTTCHDPHGTADINRDWSASLHADKTAGHAWALFNWSCDGTDPACGTSRLHSTGTSDNNNRWLCQRCHTTTGFAAHLEALASGNTALATNLVIGTDSRLTYSPTWKPETLQCNGCHSDNKGAMRRIGAYKADYIYWPTNSSAPGKTFNPATIYYNAADPVGNPPQLDIYAQSSFQFPDLGTSNICIPCHSGRTSGSTVHNLNVNQPLTVDFSNLLFGDAHRFTSAGTMFKAIGYEFADRAYTDTSSYKHNQIGTSAVPNTGTSGPCIGCHMYQPGQSASHLMAAVGKTGSVISSVSSEACFNCHQNSSAGLAAIADAERLSYAAGRNALTFFLGPRLATGVTTTFILTTTDWRTPGDSDTTGETTGKNNLGAFFNSRYLSTERGAYIHNSVYTKRIIYDSIDWLDDNQMNYSVGTSLTAALASSPTLSVAMPYLLQNGVRSGAPAERP